MDILEEVIIQVAEEVLDLSEQEITIKTELEWTYTDKLYINHYLREDLHIKIRDEDTRRFKSLQDYVILIQRNYPDIKKIKNKPSIFN